MSMDPKEILSKVDQLVSGPSSEKRTIRDFFHLEKDEKSIPRITGELWTSKQRKASSIHEISYRACFKPQLPAFFIELLTSPGDVVLDPFSGRGTTVIEAALRGRNIISNDINPLSALLTRPRVRPRKLDDVAERLREIKLQDGLSAEIDLTMFYHPGTLSHLVSLRSYLLERREKGDTDDLDRWLSMVATSRLTGHSPGFFSVYSLPPNQAVSAERQIKINERLGQAPQYRDIKKLILKKSESLLRNITPEQRSTLEDISRGSLFLQEDAASITGIGDRSVDLTVTSPPFLNVVQYSNDNWLRCWFNGYDPDIIEKGLTMTSSLHEWEHTMERVFLELYRITTEGGWVAFEVGEVRKGELNLEESIVPIGERAGLECSAIIVNEQTFTKTSNIWGVSNNRAGTNSNRIVLFRR
ncbi:MAG: DNA methyltransferase [Thermoplasmatota archaeon]